jgi:hypothetical protein
MVLMHGMEVHMVKRIGVVKKTVDTEANSGALPVPVTREELESHIVELFVHQVRSIGWMTDADVAWAIIGRPPVETFRLFDPDVDVKELGVKFSDIANTSFAKAICAMYEYGYMGMIDESSEPFTQESIYSWTSAILNDLVGSSVINEWDSYGPEVFVSARICRDVAELANARSILEGGEGTFYFHSPDGDFAAGEGALTVRQLAILSGMEEHSIRAAANPKRANPLETYSDVGRTRISLLVAKAWLVSKGRYVSIKRRYGAGDVDLSSTKFNSLEAVASMLDARLNYILLNEGQANELSYLDEIGVKVEKGIDNYCLDLPNEKLSDLGLVRQIAAALKLDADLLELRVREALANEELAKVSVKLRELFASRSA